MDAKNSRIGVGQAENQRQCSKFTSHVEPAPKEHQEVK